MRVHVCVHGCVCVVVWVGLCVCVHVCVNARVCTCVLNVVFSELAHKVFLIFCMKLGIRKGSNVTEHFSVKFSFGQFWAILMNFGPKIDFPDNCSKFLH